MAIFERATKFEMLIGQTETLVDAGTFHKA
jgi:hypothetical protein